MISGPWYNRLNNWFHNICFSKSSWISGKKMENPYIYRKNKVDLFSIPVAFWKYSRPTQVEPYKLLFVSNIYMIYNKWRTPFRDQGYFDNNHSTKTDYSTTYTPKWRRTISCQASRIYSPSPETTSPYIYIRVSCSKKRGWSVKTLLSSLSTTPPTTVTFFSSHFPGNLLIIFAPVDEKKNEVYLWLA